MTLKPPGAPAAVLPYRLGTIAVPETVDIKAFAFGAAPIRFPLKKVGFLDYLLVHLTGTVTVAVGSPAPKAGFPWNIVNRFKLDVPDTNDPFDVPGYETKIWNLVGHDQTFIKTMMEDSVLERGTGTGGANAYHDAKLVDLYPTAVATNQWELWWSIPVRRNVRDLRGILPLGNESQVSLVVTPAALAEIFATTANVTGTALNLEVYQVWQTPPTQGQVADPDTTFQVTHEQFTQPIVATGDTTVDIKRDGIILGIQHQIWPVDVTYPPAPEGSIVNVSLLVNRDRRLDRVAFVAFAKLMQRYPQVLPAGTVLYDQDFLAHDLPFIDAQGFERYADWIYTAGVTSLQSIINIAVGTTLTNAVLRTSVRRLLRA
jgi:hypothetical protein